MWSALPTSLERQRRHLGCASHANVTTARYLNVKDDYLQELIERKPLALVKN